MKEVTMKSFAEMTEVNRLFRLACRAVVDAGVYYETLDEVVDDFEEELYRYVTRVQAEQAAAEFTAQGIDPQHEAMLADLATSEEGGK